MPEILGLIRWLGRAAVVLSVIALPLGLLALRSALSPDVGDNELGDVIAFGFAILLLVPAGLGLISGSALAILAKRARVAPAAIQGPRRSVLALGVALALGEVLISGLLGGPFVLLVGLSATFACMFVVVAVASQRHGDLVVSGVLAVALLAFGAFPLARQVTQGSDSDRQRERTTLLARDMEISIDAARTAAPDGWVVAALVARATNVGIPSTSRNLPESLVGRPLRGAVVVDCAGPDLRVVTMDDADAPVVIGSVPCRPEPQVLTFEIPGTVPYPQPPAYIGRISIDPVPDEGPTGAMNRALILVALTGTPDPGPDAFVAAFVAAFGTEPPR